MKLFTGVMGLALVALQHVAAQTAPPEAASLPSCASVGVRKEIRTLTAEEWGAYESAVTQAYEDQWITWFGYLHNSVAKVIHGNSIFFPYHRKFVREYEKILQRYDPSVFVPYWNIMVDYRNPSGSPVLGDKFLGGNGDPAADDCVSTGMASSWTVNFPDSHCLRRHFGQGQEMSIWYSMEYITNILQTSTAYTDLRSSIENSIHGIVHLTLGGDMNTMHSPMDPVFWLHHSNVDRLWAQWQAISPDERTYMYDGMDINNNPATLNDKLTSTNTEVYEVMRLGYGEQCYTYDTIQKANGNDEALSKRSRRPKRSVFSQRGGVLGKRGGPKKCRRPTKCRPKRNEATQAVQKLPKEALEKYFPDFAESGTYNELANAMSDLRPDQPMAADCEAPAYVSHPPDESLRGKMPCASIFTEKFAYMMMANITQVREVEKKACDMVKELNKYGYLSAY
ncbi:hypothetical protein GGF46_000021 [Coemansia sp. RSA 552]|nr:hypothetical protein GGF46_000021 [Coemansia sp. RSA 552]